MGTHSKAVALNHSGVWGTGYYFGPDPPTVTAYGGPNQAGGYTSIVSQHNGAAASARPAGQNLAAISIGENGVFEGMASLHEVNGHLLPSSGPIGGGNIAFMEKINYA